MNRTIEINSEPLNEASLGHHETLFHNANGYIGVRGCFEEGYAPGMDTMRGMYVNGIYDIAPMKQAELLCNLVEDKEAMLNIADTQTVYVSLGGETFSMFEGTVSGYRRVLDMENGLTLRSLRWTSPSGKTADIEIKRMTSFVKLPLFTIEYSVTPVNFSGELVFTSIQNGNVRNYCNPNDPRMAAESPEYLKAQDCFELDGATYVICHTTKSGLTVGTGVTHKTSKGAETEITMGEDGRSATHIIKMNAAEGEKVTVIKYTVFGDSIRTPDTAGALVADLKETTGKDIGFYYDAQRRYLDEFWAGSEMEIRGDDKLNRAVAFNMYQLLQSAAKDGFCSIAAKGLSGEGYEGHYFWDTEMYMVPFFVLTNPELAREILVYRYGTLDKARINAGLLGHQRGALFPWRTITGIECSGYFVSGSAAYHINGDIAYAVVNYFNHTRDLDFLAEYGAEILLETARLWSDVGNWHQGRFHINCVTGPDEYTCMVNNNYFTNCGAKFNLKWAVKACELLEGDPRFETLKEKLSLENEELAEFAAEAEGMYLPYDEELGINPQDDSFLQKAKLDLTSIPKDKKPMLLHYHPLFIYRHQVLKQADTVLAYYLYENEQSRETMERSFAYYEPITTHDSSLSTCVYSIVASQLGQREKAYDYFGDSARLDLENLHSNSRDGVHTANMGGSYMAIVNGFGGLRITYEGITMKPSIPEKWDGYSFKFRYCGSLLKADISRERVTVSLESGDSVKLSVYGREYTLTEAEPAVSVAME